MAKSDSYKQGYRTGRNWKNAWVPGGPRGDGDDASRQASKEWRQGWRQGIKTSRYKYTAPVAELLKRLASD